MGFRPFGRMLVTVEVEWKVDPMLQREGWAPVNAITGQVSAMLEGISVVLDLGGGSGWFGAHLARGHPGVCVVSVDIAPRPGTEAVEHVRGSVLDLPLKDGAADIVGANAILHHVPDRLDRCMSEAVRVLRTGGIFLAQEPLAGNPPARWARGMIRTTAHEEGERPLSYTTLKGAIEAHGLEILRTEFFFLTSYLLPHLLPRVPGALAGPARGMGLLLTRLDGKLLATMPRIRGYAAYACIIARKA